MRANEFITEGVAGPKKCWPGHRKVGTQPGTGKNKGKRVNDCEKIGEGKEDKIAQLKKDHETAVYWSKNEKSPQKREAARQKAEKIKRHLDTQYKQGVAEGSLEEYGDTAKGQKMLTKVQKRAVDKVTSKKADTDPVYAKKNADTANRAWDRMTDKDLEEQFDIIEEMVNYLAEQHGVDPEQIWEDFESVDDTELLDESAAWRNKSGKNKNGGLNAKGVASYRRENPGSKLQTAVTTKPSKLKPGSKAAKRRKSFCARMGGMKGAMKQPNGKPTRKALALRKWNC